MSTSQAYERSDGAAFSPVHPSRSGRPNGRLDLQVRAIDGTTVVDILNAETLFAADDISDLGDQLDGLIEAGHNQLLLNFRAVRSMSSDVLGVLAALHRRLEKSRGRLGLTGVDPVLCDMLRICRLDRVFDIHGSEPEPPRSTAAARRNNPGAPAP
jgi:anti-anti-sigma factor